MMRAAAAMWRYFGISYVDPNQLEMWYDDWLFMVNQAEKWQKEEAKEANSG